MSTTMAVSHGTFHSTSVFSCSLLSHRCWSTVYVLDHVAAYTRLAGASPHLTLLKKQGKEIMVRHMHRDKRKLVNRGQSADWYSLSDGQWGPIYICTCDLLVLICIVSKTIRCAWQ
jgi:hypothetical protein